MSNTDCNTDDIHDTGDLLDNCHMNLDKAASLLKFLDEYLDNEIEPDVYGRADSLLDAARYDLEIAIEQLAIAHSQYLKSRVRV